MTSAELSRGESDVSSELGMGSGEAGTRSVLRARARRTARPPAGISICERGAAAFVITASLSVGGDAMAGGGMTGGGGDAGVAGRMATGRTGSGGGRIIAIA
jgi:hypothetical protein